jgi:hypothetical protein
MIRSFPSTFEWVHMQYLHIQKNPGLTGNMTKTHCDNWISWVEVKMDCDLAAVAGKCDCCKECFR